MNVYSYPILWAITNFRIKPIKHARPNISSIKALLWTSSWHELTAQVFLDITRNNKQARKRSLLPHSTKYITICRKTWLQKSPTSAKLTRKVDVHTATTNVLQSYFIPSFWRSKCISVSSFYVTPHIKLPSQNNIKYTPSIATTPYFLVAFISRPSRLSWYSKLFNPYFTSKLLSQHILDCISNKIFKISTQVRYGVEAKFD